MADSALACVCFEHADRRTCYELRYYGRSPIPRTDWDHSEAGYFVKDDGECECACHDGEDDDDEY
jgi:hypothetical protein